jgi:hypothetical protein
MSGNGSRRGIGNAGAVGGRDAENIIGRKRSIVVDTLRLRLMVLVTAASVQAVHRSDTDRHIGKSDAAALEHKDDGDLKRACALP